MDGCVVSEDVCEEGGVEHLKEWWGGVGWVEAAIEGVVAERCVRSKDGEGCGVDKLSESRQETGISSTILGRTTA